MIEGLKIDLTTIELHDLLVERIKHHEARHAAYATTLATFGEGKDDSTTSNSPRDGIKGKIENHKGRAAFVHFMADHLIPSETYRLEEEDLVRLEIINKWYR